ncbi:MAG: hypothetical protein Q9223_007702, partial [Gallowayella weberi]
MATDSRPPGVTTSTLPNGSTERPPNNVAIKIGVGIGVGVSLLSILVCILHYVVHVRKGRKPGQEVQRQAEPVGSELIPGDGDKDRRELDTRQSSSPYMKPQMSEEARKRVNELPALSFTELP